MSEEQQEGTPPMAARIKAVMEGMAFIGKKGDNSAMGYSFVRASDVSAQANRLLRENGFNVAGTRFEVVSQRQVPTKSGGQMQYCTVQLTLRIDDSATGDEAFCFMGVGEGSDTGDKAPMKACTAALKYALTTGFLVETGDDPEADDGVDQAAFERVLAALKTADSNERLDDLKFEVQAFRNAARFPELMAAGAEARARVNGGKKE